MSKRGAMAISWVGREVSRFPAHAGTLQALNRDRRDDVGNRQNLAWPPELVNFACEGYDPAGI